MLSDMCWLGLIGTRNALGECGYKRPKVGVEQDFSNRLIYPALTVLCELGAFLARFAG